MISITECIVYDEMIINVSSIIGNGNHAQVYDVDNHHVIRIEQIDNDEIDYLDNTIKYYKQMMNDMSEEIKQYFCLIEDMYFCKKIEISIQNKKIIKNNIFVTKLKKYSDTLYYYNFSNYITLETKKNISKQLFKVIKWCSANKYCLCDLKSKNIMLDMKTENIIIKIIDYLPFHDKHGKYMCTTFPPPECFFSSKDNYCAKLDKLYEYNWTYDYISLGFLIIELFMKRNFYAIFYNILNMKNNGIINISLVYAIIIFLLDDDTVENKLSNYNQYIELFINIGAHKHAEDIYKQSNNPPDTHETILKLEQIYSNFNHSTIKNITNNYKLKYINTKILIEFLSKLFRFNYNLRQLDEDLFDNLIDHTLSLNIF